MGDVSILATPLAFLYIMRAWETRKEERKSRQEEVFVPFKLPPLRQEEQLICQSPTEDRPRVALATSASHAQSTP